MELDMRIKGKFKVDVADKPRRRSAQFFWPDDKPWPRGVVQLCVEGEMLDSYCIFINCNSHTIHPGCLVVSDPLDNPEMVLYPQDLREGRYLIKEVTE